MGSGIYHFHINKTMIESVESKHAEQQEEWLSFDMVHVTMWLLVYMLCFQSSATLQSLKWSFNARRGAMNCSAEHTSIINRQCTGNKVHICFCGRRINCLAIRSIEPITPWAHVLLIKQSRRLQQFSASANKNIVLIRSGVSCNTWDRIFLCMIHISLHLSRELREVTIT